MPGDRQRAASFQPSALSFQLEKPWSTVKQRAWQDSAPTGASFDPAAATFPANLRLVL
jgi:hypothetical protein